MPTRPRPGGMEPMDGSSHAKTPDNTAYIKSYSIGTDPITVYSVHLHAGSSCNAVKPVIIVR